MRAADSVRSAAATSAGVAAIEQWNRDSDRDLGGRLFRAGTKGLMNGGGTLGGAIGAGAICIEGLVAAIACGMGGGIAGGTGANWATDTLIYPALDNLSTAWDDFYDHNIGR